MLSRRTKGSGGFKMSLFTLLLFICLGVTLVLSKPPLTGRVEMGPASESNRWTIGYFGDPRFAEKPDQLAQQIALRQDILFFAGPASLAAGGSSSGGSTSGAPAAVGNTVPSPRSFFPIWDGGGAAAEHVRATIDGEADLHGGTSVDNEGLAAQHSGMAMERSGAASEQSGAMEWSGGAAEHGGMTMEPSGAAEEHSGADAEYGLRFPHIPEDQLPGYGRAAYFVDYGEARFWFLDAQRLAEEPSAQLDWLKRTAADNPQLHRIALLHKDPMQPEVWSGLAESGVDLVLIGERLYAPESAVTGRPQAGYRSSAHTGWAEWTISSAPGEAPRLLTVEGRGSLLEAAVLDHAGRATDRLALDAAGLRFSAAVQERAPVSIGAMWQYYADGSKVRALIPQGLDLTGEHPIAETVPLPREDWRSPAYNDADWTWAPAPFGRTLDSTRRRSIRTLLPALPQSPTSYFRKSFVLDEDPSMFKAWTLHVAFEDGFVAYLNGVEIARDSIQEGLVDYRSLAAPHEGGLFESFPVTNHRNLLVKGSNTLAVELHSRHPDAPEHWFDLSLSNQR